MKKVDYIIVGDGYAALFFAHELIKANKSFVLFSDPNQVSASRVSAGMVNPVVLKRFSTFWLAKEQIENLHVKLQEIGSYTGGQYIIKEHVHRIFHDEVEKNLWSTKLHKEDLSYFLSPTSTNFPLIKNDFGTGEVLHSCRVDVQPFFDNFRLYLIENEYIIFEKFDFDAFEPTSESYKSILFSKIIFCEGIGVTENPYFKHIEIGSNKGHHLRVKLSQQLPFQNTVKKKHFLFPVENGLHFYGGTYDRDAHDWDIDPSAVEQLQNGLREFYPFDFEVVEVHFGFRPTVKDRRPILGRHDMYNNLFVFNGLGARGVLNASYFAQALYAYTEAGKPLPPEVDINRFKA